LLIFCIVGLTGFDRKDACVGDVVINIGHDCFYTKSIVWFKVDYEGRRWTKPIEISIKQYFHI
jgi:hypothetical protein